MQKRQPFALFFSVAMLCVLSFSASAQTEHGHIFGTVHMKDGEQLTGFLRWDGDEAQWSDHFDGRHIDPLDLSDIDDDVREEIEDSLPGIQLQMGSATIELAKWIGGGELEPARSKIEFGAIDELEPQGSEAAVLRLRNGKSLRLADHGSSNDFDVKVHVIELDGNTNEIRWRNIDKISFSQAPKDGKQPVQLLAGKVKYGETEVAGVFAWDADERIDSEVLDGDSPEERDMEILFRDIASLAKDGNGTQVTLRNGNAFRLTGTNDVDDGMRGVEIFIPGKGIVNIDWHSFVQVDMDYDAASTALRYDQTEFATELKARIKTKDGKTVEGPIAFDLARTSPAEVISFYQRDLRYYTPLRMIKSIRPLSDNAASVTFMDDSTVDTTGGELGAVNKGILVYSDGGKFVRWSEIEELTFTP